MLEHLDDPAPPRPTAAALAAIYSRALARRRRRALMVSGLLGAAILVVGTVVGLGLQRSPSSLKVSNLAAHDTVLVPGLLVPGVDLTGAVFPDDRHGFALTEGGRTTALVASNDGGSTWHVVDGAVPAGATAQLDFANLSDGYLWGGPPTHRGLLPLWVTSNGGKSWARAPIGPVVSDVSAIDSDVWAVVGTCPVTAAPTPGCPVVLEESTDGGTTWTPSASAPPVVESSVPSYSDQDVELARMTRHRAYVLTFDPLGQGALDRIAYTADGGTTWSLVNDPCMQDDNYSELAGSSSLDLWLLCAGPPSAGEQAKALYRSYDGGMTWALVSSAALEPLVPGAGPPPVGDLSIEGYVAPVSLGHDNLAVVNALDAWLFPAHGNVERTTDGGHTWTMVRSLQAMSGIGATGNIVFSDPTHGWVDAPGVGIWATANALSWTLLGQ